MKITSKKETIEVGKSASIKSSRGFDLVVRATDCEVDMNLGRVIIHCKRCSVREVHSHKNGYPNNN